MFYSVGKITLCASDLQKINGFLLGAVDSDVAERMEKKLAGANVMADSVLPANVVALGSMVILRDKTSKATVQVQIVEPQEADEDAQRISVVSPMGAALIGMSKDESIQWQVTDKLKKTLTIIAIE